MPYGGVATTGQPEAFDGWHTFSNAFYKQTQRIMKYFLHDTSAFEDEKISELFINFGYEGLGLFYTFLEKIAKQEKPVKTDVLKHQLKVGKKLEKCWKFMEEIGLICSSNGETFNEQLLNFSEKYRIKKEKTREKVSEWRKNQTDTKNVTSYETVSNHSKVKESKVKESKIYIYPDFFEFKNFALENQQETDLTKLELKFKAWVQADWHNGKGAKIKNWKSTLLNTLIYLKNESNMGFVKNGFNSPETSATIESINRQFAEVEKDRISNENLSDFD